MQLDSTTLLGLLDPKKINIIFFGLAALVSKRTEKFQLRHSYGFVICKFACKQRINAPSLAGVPYRSIYDILFPALLNFHTFNKIPMHKQQKRVLNHLQTLRIAVSFSGEPGKIVTQQPVHALDGVRVCLS